VLNDQKKWQEYQNKLQDFGRFPQVLFGPGCLDWLGDMLNESNPGVRVTGKPINLRGKSSNCRIERVGKEGTFGKSARST
jgi:hypothetical protein